MGRFTTALAAVLLLASGAAHAAAPSVPSTVRPGAIERALPQAPPKTNGPSVAVPPPEKQKAPQGADQVEFTLNEVDIDGATALSPDQLARTYQDFLNRKVTLADLYSIANAITALYAKHGYALSFAVVPAQQIADGRARIAVVEGFISKIVLEDKTIPVPPVLANYAGRLLKSRPLKTADLERYLLLANDIPGFTVRAVFDAVSDKYAARGATRLILHIERDRFAGSVTLDNRGSRALGPQRADLQYGVRDIFGYGEDIRARGLWAYQSNELAYGSLSGSLPVSDDGARLNAWVSYSDTRPSVASLGPASFTGTSLIGHGDVEFALDRSRSDSVWLSFGFSAKKMDGDIIGTPNSRDNIYVIDATGTYSQSDSTGGSVAVVAINQGLPIFGATTPSSPLPSRAAGSAVYTTATLNLVRQQALWGPFDMLLSASGQLASRGLLSSEQCSYGGAQFGRAFDDSELAGDQCAMGSFELRFTPTAYWGPFWGLSQLQFYGFYDGGAVWLKGALLPSENRVSSGMSTGGGVRLGFDSGTALSAEYAKPVSRDVNLEGNRNGRVFLSLSQQL